MAVVLGGLFSYGACGKFASFICYRNTKSGQITYFNQPIRPIKTFAQKLNLKLFSIGMQDYRDASETYKNKVKNSALCSNLSIQNFIMKKTILLLLTCFCGEARTGISILGTSKYHNE